MRVDISLFSILSYSYLTLVSVKSLFIPLYNDVPSNDYVIMESAIHLNMARGKLWVKWKYIVIVDSEFSSRLEDLNL